MSLNKLSLSEPTKRKQATLSELFGKRSKSNIELIGSPDTVVITVDNYDTQCGEAILTSARNRKGDGAEQAEVIAPISSTRSAESAVFTGNVVGGTRMTINNCDHLPGTLSRMLC
jgi:hypothetical protein